MALLHVVEQRFFLCPKQWAARLAGAHRSSRTKLGEIDSGSWSASPPNVMPLSRHKESRGKIPYLMIGSSRASSL